MNAIQIKIAGLSIQIVVVYNFTLITVFNIPAKGFNFDSFEIMPDCLKIATNSVWFSPSIEKQMWSVKVELLKSALYYAKTKPCPSKEI